MEELAPERVALRAALGQLNLDGWTLKWTLERVRRVQQTYRQHIDDRICTLVSFGARMVITPSTSSVCERKT